jgi:hypothetical protein
MFVSWVNERSNRLEASNDNLDFRSPCSRVARQVVRLRCGDESESSRFIYI